MANEKINLNTPVSQPSITDYSPGSLLIELNPSPRIVISIIRNDGRREEFYYPTPGTSVPDAAATSTLIENLNTVNLSTRSLWRRVFDKITVDFPSRFGGAVTVP